MERFEVRLADSAKKDIRKIATAQVSRILDRIDALAENPRPPGSRKLTGFKNRYRVRQGDYRILYEIFDRKLIVWVIKIGHRRNVYE